MHIWAALFLNSMGFPGGTVVKNPPTSAEDMGSIPGLERSPGEEHGNPLQCYCLENSMDGGAWQTTVFGVTRGQIQLSNRSRHSSVQFSSVQSLSRVQLFATPGIAACQASLSITNAQSSPRLTSIDSVMPPSHLILCHPLLLRPPIPPSIRVFSNESTLRMKWPKYSAPASASFLPKKSQGWSPSEWTGWISLQFKGLSRVFSNITVQKHQFFGAQPSSQSNSHIHTWPQEKP